MKKEKWILFSIIFVTFMVCISAIIYFNLNHSNEIGDLKNVDVKKLDVAGELESPNGKQKMTVYFRGGPFLISDYSFIGRLTTKGKKKGKFILWLPPDYYRLKWINNNEMFVNNTRINVNNDKYDFRFK